MIILVWPGQIFNVRIHRLQDWSYYEAYTGWVRKGEHGLLFIICYVLFISATQMSEKLFKSFNQDV